MERLTGQMNLNDLANIGQVIGAIALVISLIYAAFQIRQNTDAVRAPPLNRCMSTSPVGTVCSLPMRRFRRSPSSA